MGRKKNKKKVMKKRCPTCQTLTVQYNPDSNNFFCDSCSFHSVGEDFYGTTYLRGHLRYQDLIKQWPNSSENQHGETFIIT